MNTVSDFFDELYSGQSFLVIADLEKGEKNSIGKEFRALFHYQQCTIRL